MVAADEMVFSCSMDSLLCVQHDVKALNAIVLNLLINAYKYTGQEKQISVEVRDEDDQVLIGVKDNGIGLTDVEAKRIFQPFFRVDRRDKEEKGGAGLGLAIARHLVNRQGGTITVSSKKGEGSLFTVRLPSRRENP